MSCPFHVTCSIASPEHASESGNSNSIETKIQPIPQPPPSLFFGNLKDVDPTFYAQSFWRLREIYGPIFKLDIVGTETVVISNHELVKEVCDPQRFEKAVSGGLKEARNLAGNGLFTAYSDEHEWYIAHRILMPVFGPLNIRKMMPGMVDIGSQMILKWDRLGPDNEITCADDFTITFDTIAYCAFSHRFNSFYLPEPHSFMSQMAEVLIESGKRSGRTSIENQLRMWSAQHYQEEIAKMHELCDQLVAERKAHPNPEANDLLNAMLSASDPETGEKLSDENIRYQMVTFLVAGHETTSGTLSFLFYNLLKHPEKLMKLQQEVDDVVGNDTVELKHLSQLKYLDACIKETLRYLGPILLLRKHPKKDGTILGGKYKVNRDTNIMINLRGLHHDRAVWGDDADEFKPERMLDGGFERIPQTAWRPFGDGARACIGRAFAEQEMILNVALILQRFQVTMADPGYDLRLKSTMTVKPEDFKIKVRRRPGKDWQVGIGSTPKQQQQNQVQTAKNTQGQTDSNGKTLLILYGSNAGTCKGFAEDLQTNASNFGFSAKVDTLDHATEFLPKDRPVMIITPSYEGQPPDNGKKFVSWLETNASNEILKGVNYSVFGVGNSDWADTFHRIPKLIDGLINKMGGSRICDAGSSDTKKDIVGPWEDWTERLWKALSGGSGATNSPTLSVKIEKPTSAIQLAGEEVSYGVVEKNIQLIGNEVGPPKNHLEVRLPAGAGYSTGDYLVVLPINHQDTTMRVIKRFQLHPDDVISISGTKKEFLSDATTSVFDLLKTRVELNTPISQRQIEILAGKAPEGAREELLKLTSDLEYEQKVLAQRFSVLDILEDYPQCGLTFAEYLDMLKPLAPRQYSISSSPLAHRYHADKSDEEQSLLVSVTYDVHESPAKSNPKRMFHGVASSYMARLQPGDRLRCFVRPTNVAFHLPADPQVPIIMIAAGTGIAPMHGFIEERAAIAAAGTQKLGPALLYFGCRDEGNDFIYKDELANWQDNGVVEVRPAFSRHGPEGSFKYVPDRMLAEREEIAALFMKGAKIFVCGSASKLARSTAEACQKIWLEKHPDKSPEDAKAWLATIREDRYVSDVFD